MGSLQNPETSGVNISDGIELNISNNSIIRISRDI